MTDRIEALERLQRLRESGALSEEEFAAEKAALLGRADAVADSTTTIVTAAGRRPAWLVPAIVGALLLLLIVAAILILRGGGDEADTVAVDVPASPSEAQPQNAVTPAPEREIRSRPEAEQLAVAFRTAFGNRPTRTIDEAAISYRPGSLIWIGERAVLISNGTNAEECHACAGMVSVHYLAPAGDAFRVLGEWLAVATDDYGRPPEWRVASDVTGRPALRVENGGGNQGIFCSFVTYYDLTAARPAEVARVQTGFTDEGATTDEGAGTELEGRIGNIRAGRSFDVAYSGDSSFTETYRLRGARFVLDGAESRVPTC